MKFLREQMDKLKPNFQKGGKLAFLHSSFDAFETFLFVPGHTTHKGAHIRDGIDLKRTMFTVIISMLPVLIFGIWNVGAQHARAFGLETTMMENFMHGLWQVLPIIIVSYAVGLGIEFYFAQIKGHPVNEGFLVTGMLIPLCLPPTIPLWMVAIATAFAVIVGKEVFGGTGMNLLNPALTARVFLFFAYPGYMAGEYLANGNFIWIDANRKAEGIVDGFSGATALGNAQAGKPIGFSASELFFGTIPGSIGETSTLACIIGAIILIITGVGSWRIITSTFAGGLIMSYLLAALGVDRYAEMPAYYEIIMGGFAFGAVFMATDPVSAAQTNNGKIVYGLLIGIFCVLIRNFNPAYPEGMMLSILFMNVMAPLFDYFVIEGNKKRRLKRATI